jgi:D-3-phosphoglycerate dehydrogenase
VLVFDPYAQVDDRRFIRLLLEELLGQADYVVCLAIANEETESLMDARIAGAAMDVGRAPDQMPSPKLARLPNVIATPHIGGLTPPASESQAFDTVRQVEALVKGECRRVPPISQAGRGDQPRTWACTSRPAPA